MDVLQLAEMGWRLIAMQSRSKNPGSMVGSDWPEYATSDTATIQAWSRLNLNFGVLLGPSSGVIDIEHDSEEGAEILTGFAPTLTYKSAKSLHRIYKWDERFAHEKAKFGWKGTEWRFGQDRAQSVIPPSLHEDGESKYEWVDLLPVAELPDEMWQLFLRLKDEYEKSRAREQPKPIQPRNNTNTDTLVDLARIEAETYKWDDLLKDRGWTFVRNRGDAQDWWRPGKTGGSISGTVNYGGTGTLRIFSTNCQPLEDESSYDKFAFLCCLDYENDPMQAAKAIVPKHVQDELAKKKILPIDWKAFEKSFMPDVSELEIRQHVDDPGPFPSDCLLPPGFIAEVAKYTLATSDEPQPVLALGGAMCLLSVLTGRKIRNQRDNRTNLFVLGLGPSGCGKDRPRKVNMEILHKINKPDLIGANSLGSGHGIEGQLRTYPSRLFQLDEIGDLLKAIKKERGGHMEVILQKIKMLMTSSHTTYSNSATADTKAFFTIDQPHLVIFGTATPEKFWDNLSVDAIEDGFLGRILPLEVTGYGKTQEPSYQDLPEWILQEAAGWAGLGFGHGNLADQSPTPATILMTEDARRRHADYCNDIDSKIPMDGSHKPTDGLWKRARGRAASLALLFAASRIGPSLDGSIELIDVQLAIKVINWITRRTIFKVMTQVSENQFQRDCNRVLEIIAKCCPDRTTLTNRTRWLRRKERVEILESLLDSGDIYTEEVKTKTNTKVVYKTRSVNIANAG